MAEGREELVSNIPSRTRFAYGTEPVDDMEFQL